MSWEFLVHRVVERLSRLHLQFPRVKLVNKQSGEDDLILAPIGTISCGIARLTGLKDHWLQLQFVCRYPLLIEFYRAKLLKHNPVDER
jgi:hypothetical protein